MFEDMLLLDNMAGTEARKFVCPLFYINYMVSPRSDCVEDDTSELMFGSYDKKAVLKTEAATLAEEAPILHMVGAKTSPDRAHLQEPVSLKETMSIKRGDDYFKWGA